MEYKIEKGIPTPKKIEAYGTWRQLARKMKKGDSVFVPSKKERASLFYALKREGFTPQTKAEKNGYRVWRIK